MNGSAIDVGNAKAAGGKIANSIAENGLSDWLGTVRRHHEGTYQHCLLVTGVAVDFGLSLGLGNADLERLYSAAMAASSRTTSPPATSGIAFRHRPQHAPSANTDMAGAY